MPGIGNEPRLDVDIPSPHTTDDRALEMKRWRGKRFLRLLPPEYKYVVLSCRALVLVQCRSFPNRPKFCLYITSSVELPPFVHDAFL